MTVYITKSSTFRVRSSVPFPPHECAKWQGQPTHFVFSEVGSYIVQPQNFYFQKNTLHNYPSLMKTLRLLHCTHHTSAVEPLLIFGMSSNDVVITPEYLSACLTETGKSLSSSSLLPSVANRYQGVNNSSSFRSLVICFETAPVNTSIFVHYIRIWKHVSE